MSGPDEDKLKPNETQIGSAFPNQTTDFSVTTNTRVPDPNSASIDIYSTQFANATMRSDGNVPSAPALSVGTTNKIDFPSDIPGFVVEGELGRGAFGVVYRARDELLDRKVAIKRPLINNPAHRQQYIDEAKKAVKLDHPSIVPIYQVGMTANQEPFVVQKLIEGSTLREILQKGDIRLPLMQTVDIIRQVCLAVDAAHTAGIVHRDLKPENLMVEPEGRVYVADFGLAILEDDEQNKKGREVAGTPMYMSPEQFAGRFVWLDGRSDIWALGVILYELLSGKTPFTGTTLNELRDQIKNKDPRPIHQRDPKIPSAFDAVFRKCCAKNVGDRYASVREMIADLDGIVESLPFLETVNSMSLSRSGAFRTLNSTSGANFGLTGESIQAGQTVRGLNALSNAQSTMRDSAGGASVRESNLLWKLALPALLTTVLLAGIVGVAWITKFGPFAAKADTSKQPDSPPKNEELNAGVNEHGESPSNVSSDVGVAEIKPKELPVAPKPLPPSKPFLVSIGGKGTHESIAKAIADSAAGDTITILEGTYRESLLIDRSIHLVGEGVVKILSTEQACVKIQADSQVSIEKVTLDSQAAKFNTIDLAGGSLRLKQCDVFASSNQSYNCVKARANSTFVADECKFQSTVDVVVSAEKTSSVSVRDSTFNFSGNSDPSLKRIGVQGNGATGLIQRCVFEGPCIAGIDWMDSPTSELTIEGCQFDNCDIGIQTKACKAVVIKGTPDDPCELKNAIYGLSIKQSNVHLSWVNVDGVRDINSNRNRVGRQITENSEVTCTDCDFFGSACGILLNQSSIDISNVAIRDTSFVGMLVDGGTVVGNELNLLSVANYGLAVLSKGASVKLSTLVVEARIAEQKITPAVYVSSGVVEFNTGTFSNCLCGIFVDPPRELINGTGFPEKRSLIEIVGELAKTNLTTPVKVNSDHLTLTNCDGGWVFNGIGSSRVKQLDGDLSESQRMPKLMDEDLEQKGTDLTNFSVAKRPGRQ